MTGADTIWINEIPNSKFYDGGNGLKIAAIPITQELTVMDVLERLLKYGEHQKNCYLTEQNRITAYSVINKNRKYHYESENVIEMEALTTNNSLTRKIIGKEQDQLVVFIDTHSKTNSIFMRVNDRRIEAFV